MENADKLSWLSTVSPVNVLIIVLGIIALVVIIGVFVKKGILKYKGKGINIGNDDERTIVRNQLDYCKAQVYTFISTLPDNPDTKYLKRYIGELCFDEFVSAISYNHITKDTFYIQNKTDLIWAIIVKYSKTDSYKTDEFKDKVSKACREVFEHLVDIRTYYSKEQ